MADDNRFKDRILGEDLRRLRDVADDSHFHVGDDENQGIGNSPPSSNKPAGREEIVQSRFINATIGFVRLYCFFFAFLSGIRRKPAGSRRDDEFRRLIVLWQKERACRRTRSRIGLYADLEPPAARQTNKKSVGTARSPGQADAVSSSRLPVISGVFPIWEEMPIARPSWRPGRRARPTVEPPPPWSDGQHRPRAAKPAKSESSVRQEAKQRA